MEKLEIIIDGQRKKLEYVEKFAKGIYLVGDDKAAKKNCQTLKITFEPPPGDNFVQNKVTKIGNFAVVTMKVDTSYMQYIFFASSEPADFKSFLEQVPTQSHLVLTEAFNLSRANDLGSLDLLSSLSISTN